MFVCIYVRVFVHIVDRKRGAAINHKTLIGQVMVGRHVPSLEFL